MAWDVSDIPGCEGGSRFLSVDVDSPGCLSAVLDGFGAAAPGCVRPPGASCTGGGGPSPKGVVVFPELPDIGSRVGAGGGGGPFRGDIESPAVCATPGDDTNDSRDCLVSSVGVWVPGGETMVASASWDNGPEGLGRDCCVDGETGPGSEPPPLDCPLDLERAREEQDEPSCPTGPCFWELPPVGGGGGES